MREAPFRKKKLNIMTHKALFSVQSARISIIIL